MSLVKRQDKGSALTYEELDGNFTHLGGDGTYQFPSTDGRPNQVLVTNGQGQLEFQDQLDVDFSDTDIKGSVYAEDSTLLVDAKNSVIPAAVVEGELNNNLVGNVTGDVTGNLTGNTTGSHSGNVVADDSTILVESYSGIIHLGNTSITSLQDVGYTNPTVGHVLKWDGNKWASAAESGVAAAASNADLLDGFEGTYYLDYNNFSNTPSLATVATSGAYGDLSGTPTLADVATSGAYGDLSGTPTLATVATTNDFNDLDNIPAAVSINLGYKQQVFTASGTWTVPTNVTSCRVFVIGGGGAGRLGYAGTNGSQGGWVVAYVSGLTPGSNITVTVGAGGAFQGGQGGTSSFGTYATGTGGQGVNGNPPNNRTGSGSVGSGATLLTRGNNNELTNSFSVNGFPHWLLGNWRGTVRTASSGGGTNTSQLNWSLGSTVYPGSGGASQNNSNGSGTYAGVEGTVIIEY